MNSSGPPCTYGITGPTNAGHPYIKIRCLSSGFPKLGRRVWGLTPSYRETTPELKARHGLRLVVVNVEHRVKLGDLKKIAHLFVKIQKLQFSALAFHEPVPAHQFPEPCAVEIAYCGQIEHEFLMALVKVFVDQISQQRAAVAERDSTVQVDYDHAADLAAQCFERHRKPFLGFRERTLRLAAPYTAFELFCVRYRFAMITSAPPLCPTKTSNSSMNARIRRTPRPVSPNT